MKKNTIIAIIILVLAIAAIYIIKAALPAIQRGFASRTSDAKDLKGEITIALDSWIGYFPLQSPVFKKLLRDAGYKINIIDDNADYPARMQQLKDGKIDFAVVTIDSYLINGKEADFPGTIILVIDESKGGDAILAWEDKVDNIDKLKNPGAYRIAFTPDSPSDHLLKSLAVHFGIPGLLDKQGSWRVETTGAEKAYALFKDKKTDVAVLWEPHVSQALALPGVIKLLGTEDTSNLIIDILVVNRNFSNKNGLLTELVVKSYFETRRIYSEDPLLLEDDINRYAKVARKNIEPMLKGVRWLSFQENTRWFGIVAENNYYKEELFEAIESTVQILVENNDFPENPLPNRDPYTIINSAYLDNLYISGIFSNLPQDAAVNPLEREFPPLSAEQWSKLRNIGSLKLRPISFKSGTAELDDRGEGQLDEIVENIKHYPNFRILIKGHTGTRGDPAANKALSLQRAEAVRDYLNLNYSLSSSRMHALGVGGSEPLQELDGESARSYDDRLKRVELHLVASESQAP